VDHCKLSWRSLKSLNKDGKRFDGDDGLWNIFASQKIQFASARCKPKFRFGYDADILLLSIYTWRVSVATFTSASAKLIAKEYTKNQAKVSQLVF
jgi:hypothetical protein